MRAPRSGGQVELGDIVRFVDVAVDALAAAREEIDALNVYPVPDGDTGTNMYLTLSAARDAIRDAGDDRPATQPGQVLMVVARGALLGARGNSGVILSEMLGAIARRVAAAQTGQTNAVVLAEALAEATAASYAAVGAPVEGTMLSVCRAASEAAMTRVADPTARARDVFSAAAGAAREALARTPEQLEILRLAGVVDAGGRGLSVILDAAERALTGRLPVPVTSPRPQQPSVLHPVERPERPEGHQPGPGGEGPAYEVMYLLDADEAAVPALRAALSALGQSLVVVGGERLWNVHVHTDDVGAAVEAGIEAGRPHRLRVTHLSDHLSHHLVEAVAQPAAPLRSGRRIVAVAAGPGLRALFEAAGAVVVDSSSVRRPSTGEVLEAVLGCGAEEVVVLPNDRDSVRVARVAASTAEADTLDEDGAPTIRVAVIPTRAQVQGVAALAVHEPGRSFEQDVLEMTATARHARHGAVTLAARQAMTMAGPCEPGDALGVIGGDFVIVGTDVATVVTEVLARLLGGGGELVTIVSGADDADGELAAYARAWVERHQPGVDVVVYDGGQQRYPLLVSVE